MDPVEVVYKIANKLKDLFDQLIKIADASTKLLPDPKKI